MIHLKLKNPLKPNQMGTYTFSYTVTLPDAKFTKFGWYNENKIIGEEKAIQDARLYLTYATGLVLKIGAGILGIEMPEKM